MSALVLVVENLLLPFVALAVVLKFLASPRRGVLLGLREELPERFGRPPAREAAGPAARRPIWVHCASAGEVNAAAALIGRLKRTGVPVVVTTTTAAGRARARALGDVDGAWLAPLDCWPAVSSFLSALSPRALVVVETELWPHMIEMAANHGLPCALVNARMTPRTFARYSRFASLARPFVERFFVVAAQTEADAQRYRALGAQNVSVCGNLKHDLPGAGQAGEAARASFAQLGWGPAPVFCAGSTHPVEERAVVEAYLAARRRAPALKLVIAPRHVERADDCAKTLAALGVSFCRWSAREAGKDAVLVDTLGALRELFALSSVAFVGGTLVPVGGHNVLEPALAGVPVLFGPHTGHTAETARLLESAGAAFCAEDAAQLARLVSELAADPARAKAVGGLGRKTAGGLQGALDRTWALLAPQLSPRG